MPRCPKMLCAAAICLWLAGCGGSGGSGGPDLAAFPTDENISDPARLPTSGTARYRGEMLARLPTRGDGTRRNYAGNLDLSVDFGAARNQVTGGASGFVAGDGDVLDGRLRLRGGDLYRGIDTDDDYTFTGLLDGTLRRGDVPYVIDSRLEGDFRGRNQTAVDGLVFGDVLGPRGQDIFDGSFRAERTDG